MNITFIPNRSITLVTSDFRVLTATRDNPNWGKIEEAIKANDEKALINALSIKASVENFGSTNSRIRVVGNTVYFDNVQLFGEDVNRILAYITGGFPHQSMVKFLESKLRNPNPAAITSLYSFLANKEMPLTDNGTVLGFKGVKANLDSVHTGNEPLISGIRRKNGSICNEIGQTVWMDMKWVDCNPNESCGPGLHIGSRNYAKGWGPRVMVVEFLPENVGMVPNHACEVLRVNKYRVVGELNETDYLGETYNDDYSRPTDTQEPIELDSDEDGETIIQPIEKTSKNIYNISDWTKGQSAGFKDGKAHTKRKFYEVDKGNAFGTFSREFVAGYLVGYKDGRASNS